uniref:SAP domain-containing protein n=1 Tax=Anopheles maculatus TaxID=74869 RepID=A0A182SY89_9DIPT
MEQGGNNKGNNSTISASNSTSTPTTTTLRPILPTPSANLTMTTLPTDMKLLGSNSTNFTSGKEKLAKKKSKAKSITKAKPIKFHEYKGPPNAHRGSSSSSSLAGHGGGGGGGGGTDNNYQLIMQQQYLLEYLEEMCKKPTGIGSPSSRDPQITTDGEEIAGSDHTPIDSPLSTGTGSSRHKNPSATGGNSSTGSTLPSTPATGVDLAVETLNKLKVSQLKKYCKQYNLAVSGTKSNLIERLKPLIKSIDSISSLALGSPAGGSTESAELEDGRKLAEQQKRIAELQLQLKKSQEELEQFRSLCNNPFVGPGTDTQPMLVSVAPAPPPPPPPPPLPPGSLGSLLVGSPFSLSTADSCDPP